MLDIKKLKIEDPIIHSEHGIGRYHGIKKLNQIDGVILKRTKKEIVLEGHFEIKPSEYQINLPSFMLIKMEDLLKIEYNILFEKK